MDLNNFIKIFILIFLEVDLIFFSPDLEKLNIFMFALYILNYPLIDSHYFWHIRTFSLKDIESGNLNEGGFTCFRGCNCKYNKEVDLSNLDCLNFVIDMEDKKQPINVKNTNSNTIDVKRINLLLKYLDNVLNSSRKYFFLDKHLLKLHKNLKDILKVYNNIAKNDSNIANLFFYMNKSIMKINRQIQEIFYDFILNILVELNKDIAKKNPSRNEENGNTRISEEETIFMKLITDSIKYNLYFESFIDKFKAPDGIKVSLLFSDEYVSLKQQVDFQNIKQKVEYFEIIDKLYTLRKKDLIYDLKAIESSYSGVNYTPNGNNISLNKNKKLFVLDEGIIKKFIYKKKNEKDYFKDLKEPEEIPVDIENKNNLIFTIQEYFITHQIVNNLYYIQASIAYLICICFPFFSEKIIRFVLDEYLINTQKIQYFQRYYICMILKAINKYYRINKEKGIFPEMEYFSVQSYYLIIQNYIIANSIRQDEELALFFGKVLQPENNIDAQKKYENEFIFSLRDFVFENDFNKITQNFKIKGNEGNIKIGNNIIKIQKIQSEDVLVLFQEIYSYYEYVLSKDFDVKKIDVNKILEQSGKLIVLFMQFKNKISCIKILYSLMHSLVSFQKQISDYNKKNKA